MNKLIDAERLLDYGLQTHMVHPLDIEEVRNSIWRYLAIEGDLDSVSKERESIEDIYGFLESLTPETLTFEYERDIFVAGLMNCLMPKNSEVNRQFWEKHKVSPEAAAKWFYELSIHSTYIRMDRVSKNQSWETETPFGNMDITINMSKPEKNPKEIELQKTAKPSVYPKCLLCVENIGYTGNINHPARHQHRAIGMTLGGEAWYLQYSPYVYYNEHAIVFSKEHRPMKIDRSTFVRLLDFVDVLPNYFIGSNADLHTVGGSILSHDHYQAGNYEMPMMRAKKLFTHNVGESSVELLDWPLTVLKISSKSKGELIELSDKIFTSWVGYSDETYGLMAHTFERHNTVTPIAVKENDYYVMYLALRNNRRSEEHPDGIFHPHSEHHHIKKENIGLIEVMGLAVLPSRLKYEIDLLIKHYLDNPLQVISSLRNDEVLSKHAEWVVTIDDKIVNVLNLTDSKNAMEKLFREEVGLKFEKAITDSGIFKGQVAPVEKFLKVGCGL